MPRTSQLITIAGINAGLAAVVLRVIACVKTKQLTLPLPLTLPALNVVLSILSLVFTPPIRRYLPSLQQKAARLVQPYLIYGMTLVPFILFILFTVHAVPGNLQSCAADRQWLRLFEHKDATSIRGIQNRLQCCGYNSMHDRAWPFPAHNIDARACERTSGYIIACGNECRSEETSAALLTAVASFLNYLLTVR